MVRVYIWSLQYSSRALLKVELEFGNSAWCFHGPFTQTKLCSPAFKLRLLLFPQNSRRVWLLTREHLWPAGTMSPGTPGKIESCQEWGTHLTWSVLPFPDVNECELLSGVCGEAFCENVEGSFLCVCADENQEYSPMTGQCRSRASGGKSQWLLLETCTYTGLGQTVWEWGKE